MSIVSTDISVPHSGEDPGSVDVWRTPTRRWLVLSVSAALLAAIGNIGALLTVASTYAVAYPSLTDQAIAQDLVSLVVVVPLLILTAVRAWAVS